MAEYKIDIDRNVLKLLGSQLYGDMPSVIAELVANSYDANANNVWITIDINNKKIIIEDDGLGMTAEEINNQFLKIGYDKRNHIGSKVQEKNLRKPMGRKGIGKLAAFSLSNEMSIYSCKNGTKAGCILDFDKITKNNEEPIEIDLEKIKFSKDRLSENKSGTRMELNNVTKKLGISYRFVINKLARLFDVNDDEFSINIQKNEEGFKQLHRGDINYFSIMDTIISIEMDDILEKVKENTILNQYKRTKTYSDFLMQQKNGKESLKAFPYEMMVEDKKGNEKKVSFSIKGWIGTVNSLSNLKELEIGKLGPEESKIEVNDNRISIYSRGKMGEYDILSKIKSNTNAEAYIIGELFVDIFEDDELVDMAISNRRGYEESDPRYQEVIKIAKKLLGYIVKQKKEVTKAKSNDDNIKISQEIKNEFWKETEIKEILISKLDDEEMKKIEKVGSQFMRAVHLDKATKKIFISHKYEERIYGQFIVDVLEEYGIDVSENIIFTSEKKCRTGVPMGGDIFDYLKGCFRENLMVIFLFSKAFYDSIPCISEVGASWATNKNCINVVIDIGFGDISKPSNNSMRGLTITNAYDKSESYSLKQFFVNIIEIGLGQKVDHSTLDKAIHKCMLIPDYQMSTFKNPSDIIPKRKFIPKPICPSCGNKMDIINIGNSMEYECINISCVQKLRIWV